MERFSAKTAEILNKGGKNCKGRVNWQGLEREEGRKSTIRRAFVIMHRERFNTCAPVRVWIYSFEIVFNNIFNSLFNNKIARMKIVEKGNLQRKGIYDFFFFRFLKEIHAKIIHIFNYYKVKSLVGYPPFSPFLPLSLFFSFFFFTLETLLPFFIQLLNSNPTDISAIVETCSTIFQICAGTFSQKERQ